MDCCVHLSRITAVTTITTRENTPGRILSRRFLFFRAPIVLCYRICVHVTTHGLELSRNGRSGAPIKSASDWKTALPLCLAVAMMV